jgi:hypothetical protein
MGDNPMLLLAESEMRSILITALVVAAPLAHAKHYSLGRQKDLRLMGQQQSLHCPKLVEHAFLSIYGQPVPWSPTVYSDNGVMKCLTQDEYDMRWYPSAGGG